MRFVHLFTFAALLGAFQVTAVSAADPIDTPLLKESTLPYHLPPFDQIKDQHFVPAMEAGLHDQLKEVDAVANNPEKPTFENTVVALERTGRLLDRAEQTFSNLNACNTNPTLQKIEKEMAPKLSAHRDAIHLNGKLFSRIQQLYDNRDKLGLDPESAYLLERYYTHFARAGANAKAASLTPATWSCERPNCEQRKRSCSGTKTGPLISSKIKPRKMSRP